MTAKQLDPSSHGGFLWVIKPDLVKGGESAIVTRIGWGGSHNVNVIYTLVLNTGPDRTGPDGRTRYTGDRPGIFRTSGMLIPSGPMLDRRILTYFLPSTPPLSAATVVLAYALRRCSSHPPPTTSPFPSSTHHPPRICPLSHPMPFYPV